MAQRKRAAGAGNSQRDRLLRRPRPSLPFPIQVDDPAEARRRLAEVRRLARQAMLRHEEDTDEYRAAAAELAKAEAAVDACYEVVTLTAMPPAAYELAKTEHPPTAEQIAEAQRREQLPPDCNEDTFPPFVLAAGCNNGMTVEDWEAFLTEHCSDGEATELRVVILGLNERPRMAESAVLPKGWTTTLSSPLS
jgi:hypothetical protein